LLVVFKFLQHFRVDVDGETTETIKPVHEINNVLIKIGFVKFDNKWVSKDAVGVESQNEVSPSNAATMQNVMYSDTALVLYLV